jgi:hypothetical protein
VIDAVLSYHANPQTCGVTKFNVQLAAQLGVPHDVLRSTIRYRHPLVSIKTSEMADDTADGWWLNKLPLPPYDLLLHDRPEGHLPPRVMYADELGCPSTLRGDASRKGVTILAFGMAHKFHLSMFVKLKALLEARHEAYTVCVSSAIHEGSPFDATTATHTDTLRELFGDHLRWLGFLADDALAREIREAHAVALFYQPAARANNTTLWAALEAGTPVVTNLDASSPSVLQHGRSVFDISQMDAWPEANELREVRFGGRTAAAPYSWDAVIARLQAVHA